MWDREFGKSGIGKENIGAFDRFHKERKIAKPGRDLKNMFYACLLPIPVNYPD